MSEKKDAKRLAKVIKKLPTGYLDEAGAMSVEELKQEILKAVQNLRETMDEEEADEKLQGAKELVKDLGGGYKDARDAQNAKINYVLHVLGEKGVDLRTLTMLRAVQELKELTDKSKN